jgi:putative flavoprotein involved in K+ transport
MTTRSSRKLVDPGDAGADAGFYRRFREQPRHRRLKMTPEHFETVIVGGGQAGLAVGYHLKRRGQPFVVLEANEHVGDAWRARWDSLRVFTPARYCGLPGWRFPAAAYSFPTKDDIGDYHEAYAAKFELPVETGVRIDRLSRRGDHYVLASGRRRIEAERVIVAAGSHQIPKRPAFAGELDPGIVQLHSSEYRNPSQLREGGVLVVGIGNSGAEIAFEVARTQSTWLSGKPTAQFPGRHSSTGARVVFPIVRFVGHRVLTLRTPIGRKVRPQFVKHAAPLIRVKLKDLAAAGVEQVARTAGVERGSPVLEDGRVLDVANVIWCTGFREGFPWIDLPIFGEDGRPRHERGVVTGEPGLYFMGLVFQYAASSDVFPGVARDADHIAKQIARTAAAHASRRPPVAAAEAA